MPSKRQKILDLIAQFPELDDDEIARYLSISQRQTVNIICRQLEADGVLRRQRGARGKIVNSLIHMPLLASETMPDADHRRIEHAKADADDEIVQSGDQPWLSIATLLSGGFQPSGRWVLDDDRKLKSDRKLPPERGVYAFAIDDTVQYVGVANMGLRRRLYFYTKPGITQRTSRRLNLTIIKELERGSIVDIYTALPTNSTWNGLPISGIAGLEAGLIEAFHLPWNIRGAR